MTGKCIKIPYVELLNQFQCVFAYLNSRKKFRRHFRNLGKRKLIENIFK